jgi:hypothetical protein
MQGIQRILDGSSQEDSKQTRSKLKAFWPSGWPFTQTLAQQARSRAINTSDPEFLLHLKDVLVDDDTVKTAVADTKNFAQSYLNITISKLLKKLVHNALHVQQEECTKHLQRDASSQTEKDIHRLRMELIRKIEELSLSESNSYVVSTCTGLFSSNFQRRHTHIIDSLEPVTRKYNYGSGKSTSSCSTQLS